MYCDHDNGQDIHISGALLISNSRRCPPLDFVCTNTTVKQSPVFIPPSTSSSVDGVADFMVRNPQQVMGSSLRGGVSASGRVAVSTRRPRSLVNPGRRYRTAHIGLFSQGGYMTRLAPVLTTQLWLRRGRYPKRVVFWKGLLGVGHDAIAHSAITSPASCDTTERRRSAQSHDVGTTPTGKNGK